MLNFSHTQILANFCVAEWRLWIEMHYHFICFSEMELHVKNELPNIGLLLTLSDFLAAVSFCSVGEEAGETVPMLSLFHHVPAMQFEFATARVLFIGIIMFKWPHANQCWTWLLFILFLYLKFSAVKWYTSLFSCSKSSLDWILQGSYVNCCRRVNPIMGFLKPDWKANKKMGQFN